MNKAPHRRALLLAASLALLGACTDSPTQARPCELPETTIAPSVIAPLTEAHVRAGLEDAATRLAPAVLPTADIDALRRELTSASLSLASTEPSQLCRALVASREMVDRAPERPESAAERTVLRLVVDIAIAFVARHTQPE